MQNTPASSSVASDALALDAPLAMLKRIQIYLRFAAAQGREVEQIGPFTATFTSDDSNPYLNYAIPEAGAVPTAREVTRLAKEFRRRKRTPRLEFLPSLAPGVESVLLRAGFGIEGRLALQAHRPPSGAVSVAVPAGFTPQTPLGVADCFEIIATQNEAFGVTSPDVAAAEKLWAWVQSGCLAVAMREVLTDGSQGETVGAGTTSLPKDGVAEVTGVAVRSAFRRRGLGTALVAQLASEAGARGLDLVFLMALRDEEARVYGRAGFETVGDVLHISQTNDAAF